MATFEGYERREAKILGVLKEYGISSIDECKKICSDAGIDPYSVGADSISARGLAAAAGWQGRAAFPQGKAFGGQSSFAQP